MMKAIHNYSGPSYLRLGKAGEVVFHNKEPIINAGELVVIEEGKEFANYSRRSFGSWF